MELKTSIMGVGMVGGALAGVLKDPVLYDPPKQIGDINDVNNTDVVFICVPTPNNGDLTAVEDCIKKLKPRIEKTYPGMYPPEIPEDITETEIPKIIVIKSTVLPGTTDYLQKKYPQHKFLFNPEFLTESTADQDMRYPDRQIIGYTKESYTVAEDIMLMLPLAPFERIVPAKEAEMAKYYNNAWFATKVIFANQIYDLCQSAEINYDNVKEMAAADKRVGRSHLNIWHKGYRGFGGKCLPKDLDALLKFAKDNKVSVPLLKAVKQINETWKK